tara:strand:- start:6814 stop:8487 length:1674 start_codon:yes stop_codon:yes gene_type:complete
LIASVRLFLYSAVLLLIFSCAAIGPPPGGPVDKTSPFIISVTPPSGKTQIDGGLKIHLKFSERLNEMTLEKGIRLVPNVDGELKFKIKKEELTVILPENLDTNQTYILTLDRIIEDEHKNQLDQTYQLAYSTGKEIAGGVIKGTVFNPEGESSLVYLYNLGAKTMDSLFIREPDYYSMTDDSGKYHFAFLEEGDYQIISFTGGAAPFPVNPARMAYGLHWEVPLSITGEDSILSQINMKVEKEIPALNVLSVKMETSNQGAAKFTNPVAIEEQSPGWIAFSQDTVNERFSPDFIFQTETPSQRIYFYSDLADAPVKMEVFFSEVMDIFDGTLFSDSSTVSVPGIDTTKVELISPATNSTAEHNPEESTFTLQFNTPINISENDSLFHVTLDDTIETEFKIEIVDPAKIRIQPKGKWETGDKFSIKIYGFNVKSFSGNSMSDSLVTVNFKIAEKIGKGGISGTVHGKYAAGTVVEALMYETENTIHSVVVNSANEFMLDNIPSGFWQLNAYQDKDNNGRYSSGKAIPFQPSEPFFVLPDTIEVRANWIVEGLELHYPE